MNKSGLDPLQKGRAERLDAATVGFNTQKNWSEYEEKNSSRVWGMLFSTGAGARRVCGISILDIFKIWLGKGLCIIMQLRILPCLEQKIEFGDFSRSLL